MKLIPKTFDETVSMLLAVLPVIATAFLLVRQPVIAAYVFATTFIMLICYLRRQWPHTLAWAMVRRVVGHKFDTRYHWGELSFTHRFWDIELRFGQGYDDEDNDFLAIHGLFVRLYLHLPTRICRRWGDPIKGRMDREANFGFYTIDRQIVWRWALGYWSWNFPFFSYRYESREILTPSGKQVFISRRGERFMDRYDEEKLIAARYDEKFRYVYTRKNGEVQERMATVNVSRQTWSRKWFPWLLKVSTCIDVTFDQEVGEETGSWKGGCTGCGYEMKSGETPCDTLRRMERERKF